MLNIFTNPSLTLPAAPCSFQMTNSLTTRQFGPPPAAGKSYVSCWCGTLFCPMCKRPAQSLNDWEHTKLPVDGETSRSDVNNRLSVRRVQLNAGFREESPPTGSGRQRNRQSPDTRRYPRQLSSATGYLTVRTPIHGLHGQPEKTVKTEIFGISAFATLYCRKPATQASAAGLTISIQGPG